MEETSKEKMTAQRSSHEGEKEAPALGKELLQRGKLIIKRPLACMGSITCLHVPPAGSMYNKLSLLIDKPSIEVPCIFNLKCCCQHIRTHNLPQENVIPCELSSLGKTSLNHCIMMCYIDTCNSNFN